MYSVVLDVKRGQCCSGSLDNQVRMWDLNTGECLRVLEGHTSLVGLLGLSPKYFVSAAADGTLRVWDANSGECKRVLAGHSGPITCL